MGVIEEIEERLDAQEERIDVLERVIQLIQNLDGLTNGEQLLDAARASIQEDKDVVIEANWQEGVRRQRARKENARMKNE